MSKLYVIHDTGTLNFLPAEKFGEFVDPLVQGGRSHLGLAREVPRMRKRMKNMTEDDWLIACGHPFFIALAGSLQVELLGTLRMLYYDRQTQSYVKVEAKVQ